MTKDKGTKLTVYSLKGGQGKTTISCELSLELDWQVITNDIHSPLESILDKDYTLKLAPDVELPKAKELLGADLIFDFGGYLDPRIIDALKMSDAVLIPVSNFGKKLDTQGFISSIAEVENYNKNIIIILNKMKQETAKEVKKELKKYNYLYPVFEIRKSEAMEKIIAEGVSLSSIIKKGGLLGWTYKGIHADFQKLIKHIKGVK